MNIEYCQHSPLEKIKEKLKSLHVPYFELENGITFKADDNTYFLRLPMIIFFEKYRLPKDTKIWLSKWDNQKWKVQFGFEGADTEKNNERMIEKIDRLLELKNKEQ